MKPPLSQSWVLARKPSAKDGVEPAGIWAVEAGLVDPLLPCAGVTDAPPLVDAQAASPTAAMVHTTMIHIRLRLSEARP